MLYLLIIDRAGRVKHCVKSNVSGLIIHLAELYLPMHRYCLSFNYISVKQVIRKH